MHLLSKYKITEFNEGVHGSNRRLPSVLSNVIYFLGVLMSLRFKRFTSERDIRSKFVFIQIGPANDTDCVFNSSFFSMPIK